MTPTLTPAPLLALVVLLVSSVHAEQRAVGSGACSHVIGPMGTDGKPIGFTCEDVDGTALLIWSATQTSAAINVREGITTVNLVPGLLTFSGRITSTGPVAFVGGELEIYGTISGSSVLLAATDATAADVKSTLLAKPASRLVTTSNDRVIIGKGAKIEATTRDLVIAGESIYNQGKLSSPNGTAHLVVGSQFEIGWDYVKWLDGFNGSTNRTIENAGNISASNIILEAHRRSQTLPTINNTKGKIKAADTITVITGFQGTESGKYGLNNDKGIVVASKVVFQDNTSGEPGFPPHTYDVTDPIEKAQLKNDISGGKVLSPTEDNTPGKPGASVIDSTRTGTLSPTAIVVPQLTASMSHMNATQTTALRNVAVAGTSELLRGESKTADRPKTKQRAKAKPVLIRGAFFGTKISAVMKN